MNWLLDKETTIDVYKFQVRLYYRIIIICLQVTTDTVKCLILKNTPQMSKNNELDHFSLGNLELSGH